MSEAVPQTAVAPSPAEVITPQRVLVLDEQASSRSVLTVALRKAGFSVTPLAERSKAERVLAENADSVIVASASAEMNPLLTELHQRAGADKPPVVYLLGPDDSVSQALAARLELDHVLRKPAFAKDVVALVQLWLARRTGQAGALSVDRVWPEHLLRALLTSKTDATLSLGGGRGTLELNQGHVVRGASLGDHHDVEAVGRLLAATVETFGVEVGAVAPDDVRCSLRDLVGRLMPRLGRWRAASKGLVGFDRVLGVDFVKLVAVLESLPDPVNRLVRLFDGRRTVLDVITDADMEPARALEVIRRLFVLKIVKDVRVSSDAPQAFFEPREARVEAAVNALFPDAPVAPKRVDASPAADDWFVPSDAEAGQPDAGWSTGPVPEEVREGLDDELLRQLDPFRVPAAADEAAPSADDVALDRFSQGLTFESDTLEAVIRAATGDEGATTSGVISLDAAVIPLAAPVIPLTQPSPTPEPEQPLTPEVPAPKPSAGGALAQQFFAQAPSPAPAPSAPSPAPKQSSGSPAWLLVVLLLAAVVVAVVFEALREKRSTPPPAPTVSAPPTKVPPPKLVVRPSTEFVPLDQVVLPPREDVLPYDDTLVDAKNLYKAGEYQTAGLLLEKLVEQHPSAVQAWFFLGMVRFDMGDVAGARAAADQVLAVDPNNGPVHLLIATLHLHAKQREAGNQALERYLAIEPNGEFAEEARALLRR